MRSNRLCADWRGRPSLSPCGRPALSPRRGAVAAEGCLALQDQAVGQDLQVVRARSLGENSSGRVDLDEGDRV